MGKKQAIKRLLDSTKQAAESNTVVELLGFRTVQIEGVLDILTFSEDLVRLLTISGELSLFGNHFVLTSLSDDCLIFSGEIQSLECERSTRK